MGAETKLCPPFEWSEYRCPKCNARLIRKSRKHFVCYVSGCGEFVLK